MNNAWTIETLTRAIIDAEVMPSVCEDSGQAEWSTAEAKKLAKALFPAVENIALSTKTTEDSDIQVDFKESVLVRKILIHWDRKTIVRFAKHLLGDKCQECKVHESTKGKK